MQSKTPLNPYYLSKQFVVLNCQMVVVVFLALENFYKIAFCAVDNKNSVRVMVIDRAVDGSIRSDSKRSLRRLRVEDNLVSSLIFPSFRLKLQTPR